MKIEYTKVGDYYLPNLYYPEETRPIGFWGMLWKEYLKEHKPGTYTYLLLTARLDSYLTDLNEQAQERFELIEAQMQSTEGVTEELKRQNPMEWVCHCNNIRNRAAEIIKQELERFRESDTEMFSLEAEIHHYIDILEPVFRDAGQEM